MPPTITLDVVRYRPEQDAEPAFQTYEVPFRDDWVVLDALNYIKDRLDGSLSYRWSCRMGVCGSCGMMVNGKPKLKSGGPILSRDARDMLGKGTETEAYMHVATERYRLLRTHEWSQEVLARLRDVGGA